MKTNKIKKVSDAILEMGYPEHNTKVVHSESKSAWNIIGVPLGSKYKIARLPYETSDDPYINTMNKNEALVHAQFISRCFNSLECEPEYGKND